MNKHKKYKKEALIRLLKNPNALDADRDDAAMDLGEEFEDKVVLDVLIETAKNPHEINMILNSCGESIGKIWVKTNYFDEKIYTSLAKDAQDGVYCVLQNRKPGWIKKFHLDE